VWWGAIVRNVVTPVRSTAPRTATIRYDAMHGYEATDCDVVVITTSVLEVVEGAKTRVRHLRCLARSSGLSSDRRAESTSTAEGPGTEKRHEVQAED
jgi:hypothetical protein